MRRNLPRFQSQNFESNLKLVKAIKALALAKGVTASQIALSWVLQQGPNITAIPGTTHLPHLEENAQAAEIILNDQDKLQIQNILTHIPVAGDRYSAMMAQMVSVE